jgi:multidrug efflux pump subunit AcrB
MFTTLNQYHVVMEVDPKFQYGPEALNGIYVRSATGQQVPLSTLLDSVVKVGDDLVQPRARYCDRSGGKRHPAG